MSDTDLWSIPGWRAIGREAALVNQLVGAGATALGRANYADHLGDYYTAFFGLSIGMERLAKLILVADYALSNNGKLPAQKIVRRFGHKLVTLNEAADEVVLRRGLTLRYPRPTDAVSEKIITCLDSFADAGRGRYANFHELGDPSLDEDEPIRAWWSEVANAILNTHYYGTDIQKRVEGNADEIHRSMASFSSINFVSEMGEIVTSPRQASIMTGQAEIVQRYGRYHALSIVRWLADTFSELSREASLRQGMNAFFGAWEHLQSYPVPDEFLKTRKIWPLG
ncbi:hypothetical protein BN970_01564 [Mycolicibacterium conceptionense]|uniref:AbiV family abortive infection protein n=1 Tax=Mycolicibacterium conceptionense TaxID=451644 RepID=A0A0U1D7S4_9MYCO|nr:hypothetical protein [Mycolicibacterium conceptionense]CQD08099.1 hypothetical protein BN970_01564 [Mycolicibacterium conceptionense]